MSNSFPLAAALACLALNAPALAQQTPSPQSVNGCTAKADPDETRRCLELSAGIDERFVPERRADPRSTRPVLQDAGRFDEQARAPKPSLLQDRGAADRAAGPPP